MIPDPVCSRWWLTCASFSTSCRMNPEDINDLLVFESKCFIKERVTLKNTTTKTHKKAYKISSTYISRQSYPAMALNKTLSAWLLLSVFELD